MEILILGVVVVMTLVIATAIGTAALCAGLVVLGDPLDRDTITKAGGVILGTIVIQFVPLLGLLAPFVLLACIMSVFEKTWLEAIITALICWLLTGGVVLVAQMFSG